ncbi:MAG: phenylalanine--tRNA ligase subunit beta [Lachnospiraceae bacterium]|nr:phenylalanine--tRNA ligase subunit beta [Lachnospiraceae bacterium]
MFVSMNWIKDFVDLEGQDLEKLIKRFTLSTAEVEGIEYKGKDTDAVVVGEIISCEEHPNSDHLHILKVDAGDKVYDVVCGAPNARTGIKTAFCKPGGHVCGMEIKPAKLRGVESFGMCCSEKEVGISDNHDGIMELEASYENGTDLKDIFPIEDVIFEVDNKSLTNRPDLWGHYGMAREFAALTNQKIKELDIMENPYTGDKEVDISIEDDNVYRYTGVRIENVTKKVSSNVMRTRLYYCGTRAINLLADLTNYIMLELGQPMHAFDGNNISRIVVKKPENDIRFTTLDGEEREITPDTLMIYDNETPVGIAGIMGGLDSEIKDETNSVVLESANFDGVNIRKSASRMSLRTDASARYEKTLDPEMTILAIKRFIKLLKDVDADCVCTTNITDIYNKKYPELTVSFDKKFIDRYTGIDISCERIKTTLEQLGFATEQTGEAFVTKVPSWRATKDVSMKADIVEEITRIYGYDNFAIKTTSAPLLPTKTTDLRREENLVKDLLVNSYAMHEIHTRVWCDPDAMRDIDLVPEENVRILGSADNNGYLRTCMMESFLPAVYANRNYKPSFSIFEIGRVVEGVKADGTANEQRVLAISMYSKEMAEKNLYLQAVQIVNTISNMLKHRLPKYAKTEVTHAWQHPKNTTKIMIDGTEIGVLNTLHPKILKKISKNAAVVCVEINMDNLLGVPALDLLFDEPSRFPTIEYDLSLIIPENVRFENIEECWNTLKIETLQTVSVIDVYDSDEVKSITVRFVFGCDDRTLTGEEVQENIDNILNNLNEINVNLKA